MNDLPKKPRLSTWMPQLHSQIWILAVGRLLSQAGTGFTLFYAPIFFVNQVGLSSTAVGIGLGSGQISGVIGRILGGSFCGSPFWGRRRTLLLSAIVSAIASLVLAAAHNFTTVVLGNLLMGLGIGLYWPATETVVADLTVGETRNEAYAVTRLADNLGLQLGVIFGGILITTTNAYRWLFVIDAVSFMLFFGIVYRSIKETYKASNSPQVAVDNGDKIIHKNEWMVALRDQAFLVYVIVNILFTLYISQIQSTMPLYLSNFALGKFSPGTISALFTWHIALSVLLQLPMVRVLRKFSHGKALMISALLWGVGFILVGLTGMALNYPLPLAILALGILAMATISYTPVASSLVADLAPESLRGIYLAINSQCWAIGYLIGPPLGGFALDQGKVVADSFWLGMALTVGVNLLILQWLDQLLKKC